MDTGNTGFIMICAALVFIMTPGLAFFYGGLVRRKNVVNTMMACVAIMGLSVFMWTLFGYSLSFGSDHGGVIGSFEWLGLNGVGWDAGPYSDSIPHLVYAAFQMMFAMITPALITGAVVGRMKFKALFAFIALWSVIVYYPMAHMVWGQGGFLASIGSVDFAGGNVVHISSGVSALVLAIYLGRRRGYEKTSYRIHNIPFVVLGAALTCGTRLYDNICFRCHSASFMDADRYGQRRQADTGRCIYRSGSRTGRNHTGRRFRADLGFLYHRCSGKPDLLLYDEYHQA